MLYVIAFWWIVIGIASACFACFMGMCRFDEDKPSKSYWGLIKWIIVGPLGAFRFFGPKQSIKDWLKNTLKSWLADEAPAPADQGDT